MIQYPKYEIGEVVILDKEYANTSDVIVVAQSEPNRVFTTVSNGNDEWDVMTGRLTKKTINHD